MTIKNTAEPATNGGSTFSYRGLPPFAGLCTAAEAIKDGLSVDETVRRLKRYHYAFKRLHEIMTYRITAEPIYELKMAFSYHGYLCAEHVSALRARVAEMREPPLGLEQVPDPNLEIFFDEIQSAPGSAALILGVYGKAIPALQQALERHMAGANALFDAPTLRICRFALLELADMAAFGQQAIASLGPSFEENAGTADSLTEGELDLLPWLASLDALLEAAGALDGSQPVKDFVLPRHTSREPYRYDPVPRRDERFPDPYNLGVNAEAFLYDPQYPARAKILMLYYKRLREIDVPEMMASILAESGDKPWEYHHDLSRQLWDEARHAMMGEAGFLSLGLDWPSLVRINFTWSLALNTELEPWARHAVLYFIEQGLMPRNGKRFEWEVAGESGDYLAKLIQDYDWADEVLHAHIGNTWYASKMPSRKEAIEFGNRSWSRVLVGWRDWLDQGLTQHENWWPALYQAACEKWGEPPDPRVLAFQQTYEATRADLKQIDA
jgi:hypothetical protein